MSQPGLLILGRVTKTSGVRGEVMITCFAESWEPFRSVRRLWVGRPGGPAEPFEVERSRTHAPGVVLKLGGVESPEAAARLVGCDVCVPRGEAPPPPEGTFYHYDILGLQVVEGGRSLGIVSEILETRAHDVYVVRGPAGEWMLPATRAHIRRIDVPSGQIEIEPGLDLMTATAGGEDSSDSV